MPAHPRAQHGRCAFKGGRGKQDVCPHAPERSMDAAHSRAGGASPSPTFFCNCINLTREALLFFGSFCHKRNRGVGCLPRWGRWREAPEGLTDRTAPTLLRAKHGDSARSAAKGKSAKGVKGGKQEFSPLFPPLAPFTGDFAVCGRRRGRCPRPARELVPLTPIRGL